LAPDAKGKVGTTRDAELVPELVKALKIKAKRYKQG
jgi:hypothetical protein